MRTSIIILLCVFVFACSKDDSQDYPYIITTYPATYYIMPASEFAILKNEFLADKDCNFITSINSFGFCAFPEDYNSPCNYDCTPLNESRARKLTMNFISSNKKYLGIKDTSLINDISYHSYNGGYVCNWIDSVNWNVSIGSQKVQELEVKYSGIYLRLNNKGVTYAVGNWYPIVNIPKRDKITYEGAKASLIGKSFDFMCWTNIHVQIKSTTQWSEPEARKFIYPITNNNSTKLHVVWVLRTGIFEFLVDVMTGKVLAYHLTVDC